MENLIQELQRQLSKRNKIRSLLNGIESGLFTHVGDFTIYGYEMLQDDALPGQGLLHEFFVSDIDGFDTDYLYQEVKGTIKHMLKVDLKVVDKNIECLVHYMQEVHTKGVEVDIVSIDFNGNLIFRCKSEEDE